MNQRVLIVEDEPKLSALLEEYLQQAGFDTDVLDTGQDVVHWAIEQQPNLILLDVMLPVVDGFTVLRELRQ